MWHLDQLLLYIIWFFSCVGHWMVRTFTLTFILNRVRGKGMQSYCQLPQCTSCSNKSSFVALLSLILCSAISMQFRTVLRSTLVFPFMFIVHLCCYLKKMVIAFFSIIFFISRSKRQWLFNFPFVSLLSSLKWICKLDYVPLPLIQIVLSAFDLAPIRPHPLQYH